MKITTSTEYLCAIAHGVCKSLQREQERACTVGRGCGGLAFGAASRSFQKTHTRYEGAIRGNNAQTMDGWCGRAILFRRSAVVATCLSSGRQDNANEVKHCNLHICMLVKSTNENKASRARCYFVCDAMKELERSEASVREDVKGVRVCRARVSWHM